MSHAGGPTTRRNLATAISIILLATVIVGVGQLRRLPNKRRVEILHAAPLKARETGTISMTMVITLIPKHGETKSTSVSGELNENDERAHISLPPVIGPGGLELISQGAILYLSIPAPSQAALGNKRWVRVNAGSVAAAQGAGLGPIPDPLSFLAGLEGVVGAVHRLGTEKVDGTPTTKYHAVIDLLTMARRIGRGRAEQARALQRLGKRQFPMEVWVDKLGLPRQLKVEANLDEAGSIVAQLKFGNFGQPITIGIPPNDAVVPATSVTEAVRLVS